MAVSLMLRPSHVNRMVSVPPLQIPGWALMTLGCYALLSIGLALFTFRDTPEAGEELKAQEEEAREFYRGLDSKLRFTVGEIPDKEGEGVVGMNE